MAAMDLEAEYNNRARVAESAAIIAGWARDAAAFREAWPHKRLALPYGPGERERLDLFLPMAEDGAAPRALLIHGGYWQALDRSWVSHFARGLVLSGVAVAVPSYDLCPGVPLTRIVAQMRAAAELLCRDDARLLAIGHSAGGHLAAMLLAGGRAGAALPMSGVFELEPLRATTIGTALNLTAEAARALSPRWMPAPGGPVHCVVGGDESNEFLRQTRDFAAAWDGSWEALPGRNHFTVLDPLTDPASPLVARARAMAAALA
ncbi:MAG TPA: alpha/beta hydrolase [Acetobacteraceae bacterium]|nr:alpha/beta hydrolase [Acetobacteraceae bacterium]